MLQQSQDADAANVFLRLIEDTTTSDAWILRNIPPCRKQNNELEFIAFSQRKSPVKAERDEKTINVEC
ncbi:hypothetical protein ZHAS_00012510 [Anopheles sinensis]|uniref:Uncharacterized protein n=1 Tax=Anopheles sinensis TaxID=74873 RepID=A0A084W332_ANOSI|nr:hypothetical protein ZHAS_00012510 [Anopheles sinensis]